MRLGRKMRRRLFYTVVKAGSMEPLGLSRTEAYRWAARGDIPTIKDGRFVLVPREKWDAEIKRRRQQMRDAGLKSQRLVSEPVTHKSEDSEFA
jgi:hypothetical protein